MDHINYYTMHPPSPPPISLGRGVMTWNLMGDLTFLVIEGDLNFEGGIQDFQDSVFKIFWKRKKAFSAFYKRQVRVLPSLFF